MFCSSSISFTKAYSDTPAIATAATEIKTSLAVAGN